MTTNSSARPEQTAQTSVCDIPTLKRAVQSAAEDIENLGNVLGWLAQVFYDIGQKCKDKESVMPMFSIETMAEMGNYLATTWRETATSMKGSVYQAVNESPEREANHG
jgi:hypothetical protein